MLNPFTYTIFLDGVIFLSDGVRLILKLAPVFRRARPLFYIRFFYIRLARLRLRNSHRFKAGETFFSVFGVARLHLDLLLFLFLTCKGLYYNFTAVVIVLTTVVFILYSIQLYISPATKIKSLIYADFYLFIFLLCNYKLGMRIVFSLCFVNFKKVFI